MYRSKLRYNGTLKFTQKLKEANPASFHVLDPAKAARMNGKTLYIPSVQDLFDAISSIPKGETRTIVELRSELARKGGADVACPAVTIKYWKWLAAASAEEGYAPLPWWRVMKDGKVSRHMPGGIEAHQKLVQSEKT